MSARSYQPKGSMCANCVRRFRDCTHFEFSEMPVLKKDDHVMIVRCLGFNKEN